MNRRAIIVTEPDGTRRKFGSLKECGNEYGLSADSVWKRIHGMVKHDPCYYEYESLDREPNLILKPRKPKVKPQGYKERPFCPRNYNVIVYETNGNRVCTTPCRFEKGVKVGSAGCQRCKKFRGRDKVNHLVACAHKGKDVML